MAASKTETEKEKEKKVPPKVDLYSKWALEQKCFNDAKIKDLKTGKETSWPYFSSDVVRENTYKLFLEKVVDETNGEYYPKRDEEGKPVNTSPNPKHVINTIIRLKRKDGSQFLLSKGYLKSYDALGDEVSFYIPWPEKWLKTNFKYVKDWDPKRKAIVKNCTGPGNVEEVYTLEFNEKNLKMLFDKRQNDIIGWVLKDELAGTKTLTPEPNINDTFKLFLKPFDYLYNGQYISPEMRAQYRQEAIDAGILSAPTTTATVTPSPPPSTGTYS